MRSGSNANPRSRSSHVIMAWAVIALGVIGVKSVGAQCMYEITAIVEATPCGPGDSSGIFPEAINDLGVVTGSFGSCSLGDRRPFIWSAEAGFVEIPLPLGVTEAETRDINNNGEIVGRRARTSVNGYRAFHYKDGVWTELSPTGNGIHSEAFGINDDGWVCGYRDTDEGRVAFRWRGDVIEDLVSPIGGGAVSMDVSDSANSTGIFGTFIIGLGFLWGQEKTIEIPPLRGGTSSEGRGINNHESVAGQSRIEVKSGSVPRRSWVFEHDTLTDLGVLPEADHRTIANDINDASQIVGRSEGVANSTATPFLWQHGELTDLGMLIEELPEDLFPRDAIAINQNGQIVVSAASATKMVVLTPIDRPLGDVNIDCVVDERDLIAVLDDWGPNKANHPTDMVTSATFQSPGDGKVDGADLAVVLGNWSISTEASAPMRWH